MTRTAFLLHSLLCVTALAQSPQTARPPAEGQQRRTDTIELNLGDEIELGQLIDYVSKRLAIGIVYDQSLVQKKIAVRAPSALAPDALLPLLDSALQVHGLVLSPIGDGAWRTVAQASDLAAVAAPPQPANSHGATASQPRVMTRVFTLKHGSVQRVESQVKPFVSKPGGNMVVVPEQNLLIVSDLATNFSRLESLIELLDQPARALEVRFKSVENAAAQNMAGQLKSLLAARQRSPSTASSGQATAIEVLADPRTNLLAFVGEASAVDEAVGWLDRLDVAVPEQRSPIRFYKIVNTTASKVVETIRLIEGGIGSGASTGSSSISAPGRVQDQVSPSSRGIPTTSTSAIRPPGPAGSSVVTSTAARMPGDSDGSTSPIGVATSGTSSVSRSGEVGADAASLAASVTGRARVIADVNTNSVIVVGDLAVQTLYEGLIRTLDQRRPQVVIETTLVMLDTSQNFSFGVEISKASGGDPRVLTFSSFGLSTADKTTGRLSLSPTIGFNGAVISADIADIVIQALKKTGRARVLSAPKILVTDNATGRIASTVQQPFQSVNASTTVATTSFGGFVEAGTAIQVTPHISNDDHLQLEYSIELSSFQGQAAQNLPPPRAQNTVESTVMLPNGHTIITGGLTREDSNNSVNAVPLLGELPVVGALFRNQVDTKANSTLFVFIRPTVLRDDEFEDLKQLSEEDRSRAGIPSDLPQSSPQLIP